MTDGREPVSFRVGWDRPGDVTVRSIAASMVERGPGRDPEGEWWKALGWIVVIGAVGIDLRRRAA